MQTNLHNTLLVLLETSAGNYIKYVKLIIIITKEKTYNNSIYRCYFKSIYTFIVKNLFNINNYLIV